MIEYRNYPFVVVCCRGFSPFSLLSHQIKIPLPTRCIPSFLTCSAIVIQTVFLGRISVKGTPTLYLSTARTPLADAGTTIISMTKHIYLLIAATMYSQTLKMQTLGFVTHIASPFARDATVLVHFQLASSVPLTPYEGVTIAGYAVLIQFLRCFNNSSG